MDLAIGTTAISVSDYSARIGRVLRSVGPALIEGEVQKPRVTTRGMLFFDLTDGDACLPCKVFASSVRRLRHHPAEGDLVQVTVDRPDFWPQKGKLDLIVSEIRLTGEGELLRRREDLLRRLRGEGLCDPERRKPLPTFPRAVGVIAGRNSDGMSDVIQALRDRFPPVHIITCAATVQGRTAPRDIIDALAQLQGHPLVDVIVIARGGGSVQDLVAFDDERLCRAIFACDKPVVAAIGHTDNVPVCNHVAWPAFTPSRSAEMVVPSAGELCGFIAEANRALAGIVNRLERGSERLSAVEGLLVVPQLLDARAGLVQRARTSLEGARHAFFTERHDRLARAQLALASIPRQMPSASDVGLIAAALDTRAHLFFRDLEHALSEERRGLGDCDAALADVGLRVCEMYRRLEVGTRRQLADHARDYGNALVRLGREALAGVRRRFAEADRSLCHVAEVIAARDFRSRGWVIATDEEDAGVASIEHLSPGSRLRLTFADGVAHTRVDRVLAEGKEKR